MTFRVGQKVVCVDAAWPSWYFTGEQFPILGVVYTIRQIVDYPEGPAGLLLVQIVNAPQEYDEGFCECDFGSHRFRPVVETDISIFTSMLKPIRVDA